MSKITDERHSQCRHSLYWKIILENTCRRLLFCLRKKAMTKYPITYDLDSMGSIVVIIHSTFDGARHEDHSSIASIINLAV